MRIAPRQHFGDDVPKLRWWEQPLYLDVEDPGTYVDVARYPAWPSLGLETLPEPPGDGAGLIPGPGTEPEPKPPHGSPGWVWSMWHERWSPRVPS